jgi:tyrosyl-tRNA synthetase
MGNLKSEFLKESKDRGFIHQGTDMASLDHLMKSKKIVAYIGFDATADALHVGSLVQIMWLRLLQRHGHKPIILMGGGTTKMGDPSYRHKTRPMLSPEKIKKNIEGISKIFSKYLTFGGGSNDALLLNNDNWLKDLNYLRFLREYGRYFSVNRMLGFESVKLRLEREQHLSFLEFNYMIVQAYDFLQLYRLHKCVLELGGSDQWGNIVNGIELTRRIDNTEVYGLTAPLITTANGSKMGKTEKGAIWLDPIKISPFDFWQFWRNTQDVDVGRFLRLFTDLPLKKIRELDALQGAEINEAKKVLANEVTRLAHGDDAVMQARAAADQCFTGTLETSAVVEKLVTIKLKKKDIENGITTLEMFRQSGLVKSGSEARRLIKGGGGRLNDIPIQDGRHEINLKDFGDNGVIKLSAGKKHHVFISLA